MVVSKYISKNKGQENRNIFSSCPITYNFINNFNYQEVIIFLPEENILLQPQFTKMAFLNVGLALHI